MSQNPLFGKGLEWLSRTLAILTLMVGPAFVGNYLDRRFGTMIFAPAGLVLGMLLGTSLLLLLANKLTPAARGNPLPLDDDRPEDEWDENE